MSPIAALQYVFRPENRLRFIVIVMLWSVLRLILDTLRINGSAPDWLISICDLLLITLINGYCISMLRQMLSDNKQLPYPVPADFLRGIAFLAAVFVYGLMVAVPILILAVLFDINSPTMIGLLLVGTPFWGWMFYAMEMGLVRFASGHGLGSLVNLDLNGSEIWGKKGATFSLFVNQLGMLITLIGFYIGIVSLLFVIFSPQYQIESIELASFSVNDWVSWIFLRNIIPLVCIALATITHLSLLADYAYQIGLVESLETVKPADTRSISDLDQAQTVYKRAY